MAKSTLDDLITFIEFQKEFALTPYDRRMFGEVLEELWRLKDLED